MQKTYTSPTVSFLMNETRSALWGPYKNALRYGAFSNEDAVAKARKLRIVTAVIALLLAIIAFDDPNFAAILVAVLFLIGNPLFSLMILGFKHRAEIEPNRL